MSHSCDNSTLTFKENQTLADLEKFGAWIQVYIPLALSAFGLLFTTLFLFVALIGVRRGKLAIHFYYCLINRSLADVLCALSLIIALITVLCRNEYNKNVANTILDVSTTVIYGTFFEATFTLLTLLTLKTIAIQWPLRYKQLVTRKRVIKVLVLTWPVTCLVTVLVFIPHIVVWISATNTNYDCWLLYRSAPALLSYIVPGIVFLAALLMCLVVVCMVRSAGRLK